jgi:hypothetical protein
LFQELFHTLPDRIHLGQQSVATGVKRYQLRSLDGSMGVRGMMVTHQGIVFGV